MCVIIAKSKEARIPTISELENCFKNNNDGAGFMYIKKGKVVIDKGYMTQDAFINHFKHLCNKFDDFKNQPLVIHCRIGTAGTNTAQNTHPYPISDSIKRLHKTYTTASAGVVHNGIISDYTPGKDAGDVNDTQLFITNFLSPLYNRCNKFYTSEKINDAIAKLTGSKFVILNKDGNIYTIGDFINEDGVLFSNSTYKQSRYTYYNDWNDWKYYEDDYYNYLDDYNTASAENDDSEISYDEDINYSDLVYIPETYLLEYDDSIHDGSEEIYYINTNDGLLYRYNTLKDCYEELSSDYIIYNEELQPVVML